jgi:hypothetical protein
MRNFNTGALAVRILNHASKGGYSDLLHVQYCIAALSYRSRELVRLKRREPCRMSYITITG